MLNEMKNEFNKTRTTNGDHQFTSSLDSVLDLFAKGGAMRKRNEDELTQLFSKALSEDAELTLKVLFYLRDVRGGMGEKRIFRESMKHLAVHDTDSFVKVLKHVPEFGSWKDVVELLDVNSKKAKTAILDLIHEQISKDVVAYQDGKHQVSLIAKWLPSENASSKNTKFKAVVIRKHLGVTSKRYRKILSALRKEIGIVESKMSAKQFGEIDYSKVPTQANLKYREAFKRNDGERYSDFLDSVVKGDSKINAGTLAPHQIVEKVMGDTYRFRSNLSDVDVKFLDEMWKAQTDHIGDNVSNALVMADVSGSMTGTPMHVSIGLGMYIAERNKGKFHNHFMTFSSDPSLVEVKGKNVVDKIKNMSQADWGMSTNLDKAMKKILSIAVKGNLPQEELPTQLIVISDMQFNEAVSSGWYSEGKSVTQETIDSFREAGYLPPSIVFWNVNATTLPVTKNDKGVALVSGFQPAVMKQIMNAGELDPIGLMMDVIGQERYSVIKL